MELLSPAGSFEAFIGAINAGCDAVYLGGTRFGARAFAQNFTDEEILRAIKYAHLFNVKVYLTVNTLIKESEWDDVISYIDIFYKGGLDGCILQDFGLISVFPKLFPGLECHISTQAFDTGKYSVRFFKNLGANRVVLARELSLSEIKEIKKSEGIEIETFIHGAMCYAYSGNCLFSSCLGGRSGNRGRCAGPCRLEYSVILDGHESAPGFYLSMKDQCALSLLPKLTAASIDSLKIEGRMKKPEYAAFVTHVYRKYLDNSGDSFKVAKDDLNKLKHMYIRSDIGEGYYFTRNGKDMISVKSPAYAGTDESLMKETEREFLKKNKTLDISAFISVKAGENITLTFGYGDIYVSASGKSVLKAENRATTESEIAEKIMRLGDTCFSIKDLQIDLDEGCFVPASYLNELRRECADKLTDAILCAYEEKRSTGTGLKPCSIFKERTKVSLEKMPIIFVNSTEQFLAASKFGRKCYIAPAAELFLSKRDQIEKIAKEKDLKLFVSLPYVMRDRDEAFIRKITIDDNGDYICGAVCQNTEELGFLLSNSYSKALICADSLYVWNHVSYELLDKYCDYMIAPLELSAKELFQIKKDMFVFSYGRIPLMNTANCICKTAFSCKKEEGVKFMHLRDRKNILFPVKRNCEFCFNTIFNSVPTSLHEEVTGGKIDRESMVLSFTDEGESETAEILNAFLNNGEMPGIDTTKAYRKRGVE